MFFDVDVYEVISIINKWEIELIKENNFAEKTNSPYWYGYKRVDWT